MSGKAIHSLRHELWKEYSKVQVDLLRVLRGELSSRRWQIMLDVDEAERLVRQMETLTEDQGFQDLLSQLADILSRVHSELARIPEDMLPAF